MTTRSSIVVTFNFGNSSKKEFEKAFYLSNQQFLCVFFSSFFLELSCDINTLHFTTFENAARTLKICRCILYMKTGIKYLLEMKRKPKKYQHCAVCSVNDTESTFLAYMNR